MTKRIKSANFKHNNIEVSLVHLILKCIWQLITKISKLLCKVNNDKDIIQRKTLVQMKGSKNLIILKLYKTLVIFYCTSVKESGRSKGYQIVNKHLERILWSYHNYNNGDHLYSAFTHSSKHFDTHYYPKRPRITSTCDSIYINEESYWADIHLLLKKK